MLIAFVVLLSLLVAFDLLVLPRTKTTKISCRLELASVNSITGDILYTFIQVFPRIILAEINTHLVAGKNTASSRAIPTLKQLKRVLFDPFVPYKFGTYKSGMQAGPDLTGWRLGLARQLWLLARWPALVIALLTYLWPLRLAKQISNRLVEQWMWVEQIWTATDVKNEMLQRNHPHAEPHYQELARQKANIIRYIETWLTCKQLTPEWDPNNDADLAGTDLLNVWNRCQFLLPGQWHLPFVGLWARVAPTGFSERYAREKIEELKQVSAGRCAWVSYYMPGSDSKKMENFMSAINTYSKLADSDPKHLSPLMHQGTPLPVSFRCGNLVGFLQFRKEIPGETGGEKVVESVTPGKAKLLIENYEYNRQKHSELTISEEKAFVYDTMEA